MSPSLHTKARSVDGPGPIETVAADAVRLAVVGAGRWGRLHARKIAEMPSAELAAVVDRDLGRARALAEAHGVPALASVARLADGGAGRRAVHGAVVAVDLPQLAPVTAAALDAGLHVLAEKPLALHGAAARELVELAARRRRLLAVGFVERFALPVCSGRRMVSRRVGPRRGETPIGLDWLVHDIDHALRCLGPDLRLFDARFDADLARIRLVSDRAEARLRAARRPGPPWRRLWLDGHRFDLTAAPDPLALEVAAFCRAISGGPAGPLATGADAAAVLAVLDALDAARPAA